MNNYLSHGMGVNSTALMLLLQDQNIEFESVFVDHRGDYPETYEYLAYLRDKGYEITVIKPQVSWKGKWDNIYDYFFFHKSVPFIRWRICTDKFKIRPFNRYIKNQKPCVVYIGIDSGEKNRVWKGKRKKGITYQYPLIEQGINRFGCKQIIKDHGLKIPRKSGCWFCPFQKRKEWIKLMIEKPELYWKAVALEENSGKLALLQDGKYKLRSLYQKNKLHRYIQS